MPTAQSKTFFDCLKELEGKRVILRSHFMGMKCDREGTLKVEKTTVYPHAAYLELEGQHGGYFAGLSSMIAEGGGAPLIVLGNH